MKTPPSNTKIILISVAIATGCVLALGCLIYAVVKIIQ